MKTILVAIDSTKSADRVAAAAMSLVQDIHVKLVFVQVSSPSPFIECFLDFPFCEEVPPLSNRLASCNRLAGYVQLAHDQGILASAQMTRGFTLEQVVLEAEKIHAHLVVMKAPLTGGGMTGVTMDELIKTSPCPVVFVPNSARKTESKLERAFAPAL